jgi:uncharacterized surface protein with fasciclin (FAS1) repeats
MNSVFGKELNPGKNPISDFTQYSFFTDSIVDTGREICTYLESNSYEKTAQQFKLRLPVPYPTDGDALRFVSLAIDDLCPQHSSMTRTNSAPAPDTAVPGPTSTSMAGSQGMACEAYRKRVPSGPGSIESMALQTGSEALANNPDLSTFSAFISGKSNPEIDIVKVLDSGPYVVFAPTNEAFAKLDPATLATLKSDPVVLLPTLFYHIVLGDFSPNDLAGTRRTQDGRPVVVTGKGDDMEVNGNPVVCGYTAHGAHIYMIDEVLTPPTP